MKAKFIHHSSEWIEGDFSPPEELDAKPHLTVWHKEQNVQTGDMILKLQRGAGVWSDCGGLIFYNPKFADLSWTDNSTELLCVENRFAPCSNKPGVGHLLKRFKINAYAAPYSERDICVPSGGAEYLIADHQGEKCLVTWLDQSEWGFILIDLRTMMQLPIGFQWKSATVSPPQFSPDGSIIISCNFYRARWWTKHPNEDDDWDSPSVGGLFKIGVISIYEVSSGAVSNHDVLVLLTEGWLPENPESSDWDMIWGPEFISNNSFRIWLPGGNEKALQLPLPEKIIIDDQDLSSERIDKGSKTKGNS